MSDLGDQLDELISDETSRLEYAHELAISAFTNQIARHMTEQGPDEDAVWRRAGN